MKVFISWSGERSRKVAEALQQWLPRVIQATEPWISTEISKGSRWGPEISSRLEESRIGIHLPYSGEFDCAMVAV
jgi:hypothetical protein